LRARTKLIEDFQGGDTASAARLIGVFGTLWATMQFLASPVLGAISDRVGRRPVILLSNLGLGFDYILMALAPTVWWLLVGRLISGITSASIATAYAYIADVTTPDRRARAYGLLGAAFGIGFVVGPVVGGVLGETDPRLPFWVAAGLSLANFLYGWLILPESLAREHRGSWSWRRMNPLGGLRLLRSHPQLKGFAIVHFLFYLAHQVLASVFVLYTGYRYGWSAADVGWALTGVGVMITVVQAGLVGRSVAWFGERPTLVAGLLFGMAGFAAYGLAPTGLWFMLGIPLMSLWGLYGPAAQGMMTRRVGPTEQGRLQGALAGVTGITGIVGPGMFSLIFAASIGPDRDWHAPGAPFLTGAVVLAVAAGIALRITRPEAGARPAAPGG
jgi:DHA1 family tetracycline resistance protein-like MFS transporter